MVTALPKMAKYTEPDLLKVTAHLLAPPPRERGHAVSESVVKLANYSRETRCLTVVS